MLQLFARHVACGDKPSNAVPGGDTNLAEGFLLLEAFRIADRPGKTSQDNEPIGGMK